MTRKDLIKWGLGGLFIIVAIGCCFGGSDDDIVYIDDNDSITIKKDSIEKPDTVLPHVKEKVRHMEFYGIPIDNDIDTFARQMESKGYTLDEKVMDEHLYIFSNSESKAYVHWDDVTGKVFMVQEVCLNVAAGSVSPFTYAEEAFDGEVETFNESFQCIENDRGCVVLTDGDDDDHEVLIYLDKINSQNYELYDLVY